MINNVVLVGRITAMPELKMTPNGKGVCNFTLAVSRSKDETDFIKCSAWGNTAKFMIDYVKKGNILGVEGSIRVENYTSPDNKKLYSTSIICNNVRLLEGRKDAD